MMVVIREVLGQNFAVQVVQRMNISLAAAVFGHAFRRVDHRAVVDKHRFAVLEHGEPRAVVFNGELRASPRRKQQDQAIDQQKTSHGLSPRHLRRAASTSSYHREVQACA